MLNDPINKIPENLPITEIRENGDSLKVDSGLSSIEKSKSVRPDVTPSMSVPSLAAPSDMDVDVFAIVSVDSKGLPIVDTVQSLVLKGEEIKTAMLRKWTENLREIAEQVRQLLNSPMYIQLQEIVQKGDPRSQAISGIQGTSTNGQAKWGNVEILSSLDRLQVLEKVPPSVEISDSSAPQDTSQVLVLPLTAALLASGGLAIGLETVASSNPLSGIVEWIGNLQPIFPQVAIQDIIPMINLMVIGPIYYNSWNEAISNLKKGKHETQIQMVHNFAKDVLKIVVDPQFVTTLMKCMKGTDKLSSDEQDRLVRMLKVVLIGVALSLLYSVEVGKLQDGKYGGIEPEELKSLLLGEWEQPNDPKGKLDLQKELTSSLIKRCHEILAPLSIEDRTKAVEMLLEYITKHRDVDHMLDPAKVFDETLESSQFNPNDQINLFKV